jgi:hypothetical protein
MGKKEKERKAARARKELEREAGRREGRRGRNGRIYAVWWVFNRCIFPLAFLLVSLCFIFVASVGDEERDDDAPRSSVA